VVRSYGAARAPFGNTMTGDVLRMGAVRSQADYVVFDRVLGMSGLDVAFWYPRAEYHTENDDAAHTSRESLWHMLSTAKDTLDGMLKTDGDDVKESSSTEDPVWFDGMFSLAFLRMLFEPDQIRPSTGWVVCLFQLSKFRHD